LISGSSHIDYSNQVIRNGHSPDNDQLYDTSPARIVINYVVALTRSSLTGTVAFQMWRRGLVQAPPSHPSRATEPRRLALKLAATYLAVTGVLGAILLLTSRETTVSSTPARQPEAQAVPQPVWTTSPPPWTPATTTTTTTTTTTSSETLGFRRVITKAGMTTVVPSEWSVADCTSGNGCEQSNDPADSERFLRFGGSPSPAQPLAETQGDYEKQFAKRAGYQQLRLQPGEYHGYPAVEWEFELTVSGVRKHIRVTYWRAAGNDNFVYASSTVDGWPRTLPIYQAMLADSTP
jgi:hypothetical protein